MKMTTLRIDEWLYNKLNDYDLSIQESCIRVAKQIKKGKLKPVPSKCGNFTKFIKYHITTELVDIDHKILRGGLQEVFSKIRPMEYNIKPEDTKYINVSTNLLKGKYENNNS